MKLISIKDTLHVAGGTIITIDGVSISVNTSGIPGTCVDQFTAMAREMVAIANAPGYTNSQLMTMMGRHMDIFEASGCTDYLEAFNQRLSTAQRV